MKQFLQDVIKGLSAPKKYLESKYFYDAKGDELFRQIMACDDYYLTNCEMEIFTSQTAELAACFTNRLLEFDVVELGAGDATKSVHLLKQLVDQQVPFTYYPVDISTDVISLLHRELPRRLPDLKIQGLNGEYFTMLTKAKTLSDRIKVVLFLGSNIGNIPLQDATIFCRQLRDNLVPGDLLLIGFDLQKNPQTILNAYNDRDGFTRQFNINLLERINKDLSGNFDVNQFLHFPTYDPGTGACKSYLVSLQDQQVEVADHSFNFYKYESIFMEVSQKYTIGQIEELAVSSGFKTTNHFFDSKNWFVDAVWECV